MIDIGKALREHRKAAELSQSELAAKMNIKQQNISRWENGTQIPNVADCIVLADFFGISIDYLVGYENEDGSKNPINWLLFAAVFRSFVQKLNKKGFYLRAKTAFYNVSFAQ